MTYQTDGFFLPLSQFILFIQLILIQAGQNLSFNLQLFLLFLCLRAHLGSDTGLEFVQLIENTLLVVHESEWGFVGQVLNLLSDLFLWFLSLLFLDLISDGGEIICGLKYEFGIENHGCWNGFGEQSVYDTHHLYKYYWL